MKRAQIEEFASVLDMCVFLVGTVFDKDRECDSLFGKDRKGGMMA